jgi:hypothetical protein
MPIYFLLVRQYHSIIALEQWQILAYKQQYPPFSGAGTVSLFILSDV